jgi:hypothetical protein
LALRSSSRNRFAAVERSFPRPQIIAADNSINGVVERLIELKLFRSKGILSIDDDARILYNQLGVIIWIKASE